MTRAPMHATAARRAACLGLAATFLLVLAAAGTVTMFAPGATEYDVEPLPQSGSVSSTPTLTPVADVDLGGVGSLLAGVWTPTREPKQGTPVEPTRPEPAPVDTEPIETPGEWQYLGSIRTSTRLLALLKIDGTQKLLSKGKSHEKTTIVDVHPDYVLVREDGIDRKIDRAEKDGALVGTAQPTAPLNANNPITATTDALARAEAMRAARDAKAREEADRREEEIRKRLEDAERRRAAAKAARDRGEALGEEADDNR